jgi:hypothetical protein
MVTGARLFGRLGAALERVADAARRKRCERACGPPSTPAARTRKTGWPPGLPLSGFLATPLREEPTYMPSRTVAARRTEPQGPNPGRRRHAPEPVSTRFRLVRPAAPRASARRRCPAHALGRWRCRWSTPLPLVAVAGTGRRASRCRTSPGVCSCARCSPARGVPAGARRLATTAWRPARTRSSATCSASGTQRAQRATRRRSSSSSWGWRR